MNIPFFFFFFFKMEKKIQLQKTQLYGMWYGFVLKVSLLVIVLKFNFLMFLVK